MCSSERFVPLTVNAMKYNVAQMMKSPVGERRSYPVVGEVVGVDEQAAPIPVSGDVELVRTNHGILAHVVAFLTTTEQCSRCLAELSNAETIEFDEVFFPTIDIITGAPAPKPTEPDPFLIDHNHVLDLAPAIREYAVVARPMQPLCRADCQGLCPSCGADLNVATCACRESAVDPRWAALRPMQQESS
ncbi:MAG: DUF177 domain-containing protein [Dehalococcoidia bacterium]|nr:DUF177 domain-containing protein [Dehalococcoidia bacterium]